MAGDASFASVSTLLHLDTDFVDVAPTPKIWTPYGGAAISATAKFGAGSMSVTGGNSYISAPHHADFNFGTGQFTVECWFRCNAFSATQQVYAKSSGTNGITRESGVSVLNSTTIQFYYGVRGTSSVTHDFTVPTMAIDTWYHLAITRDSSNDIRVFLGGTASSSGAWNDAVNLDGTLPFYIGSFYAGSVLNPFNGFIDEFRATKGVCRYNASFTAPSARFIAGLGQVAGTVRDAASAPVSRTVRCYRRDTGALVGSATSDVTTGVYAIDCATLDEVGRVVLDDASGTLLNDSIDRVIPA